MARALECPACGSRTALQSLPDAPTFKCERCGQVLKVPSEARPGAAQPPPAKSPAQKQPAPRQPAAKTAPAAAPTPPPRSGAASPAPPPRRGAPSGAVSSAAAAAAVSATVNQGDPVPSAPSPSRRERREGSAGSAGSAAAPAERGASAASAASATEASAKVRWYWRILAWVVAVPLGFLLTAYPAYHFKWIKKNDLLDVFVGTGTSRYTRLIVLTLGWALVTALLVQLFVEGGRWIARRRRAGKAASGDGDVGGRPRRPEPQPQSPAPSAARPPAAPARR
jgi:hypothetical protein